MTFSRNNWFGEPDPNIDIIKSIVEGKKEEQKPDQPQQPEDVVVNPEVDMEGNIIGSNPPGTPPETSATG